MDKVLPDRHEALLKVFLEVYQAKQPVREADILERMKDLEWVKNFWDVVTLPNGDPHCYGLKEDLEYLYMRGYVYIEDDLSIIPTRRVV